MRSVFFRFNIISCFVLGFLISGCNRFTEEQKVELANGSEVYIANCISCHGVDGKGLGGAYPSLIREKITPDYTARVRYLIANGSPGEGGMLPVHISTAETREVINYIQNTWGNEAPFESSTTVSLSKN